MKIPRVPRKALVVNGGLVVALLAAGTFAFRSVGTTSAATTAARTVTVSRGEVTQTVSASGNLSSATSVAANFSGSAGTVTAIYVAVGDTVSKGQALATVDKTSAEQGLISAQASLAQARAQLETTTQGQSAQDKARDQASVNSSRTNVNNAIASYNLDKSQQDAAVATARTNYDNSPSPTTQQALTQAQNTRDSVLLKDSQQIATAQSAVASAQANAAADSQPPKQGAVDSARAQVTAAQVQVDQAQQTVDQTTLTAPLAGTVTAINGSVGGQASSTGNSSSSSSSSSSAASSSSSSSSTSGFIVISDLTALKVTSLVAEADASKVALAQTATVTFPAVNKTATGSVTAIDSQSTVSNNVVEYGVTVTLQSQPSGLKLGQTASVVITTATRTDVLSAPSSAITKVGNFATVTVQNGSGTSTVTVQLGLSGDTRTEFLSGVKDGDVLVVPTTTDSSNGGGLGLPRGLGGVGGAGLPG